MEWVSSPANEALVPEETQLLPHTLCSKNKKSVLGQPPPPGNFLQVNEGHLFQNSHSSDALNYINIGFRINSKKT